MSLKFTQVKFKKYYIKFLSLICEHTLPMIKLLIPFTLVLTISAILINPSSDGTLIITSAPLAPAIAIICNHDPNAQCKEEGLGAVVGISSSGQFTVFPNPCEACKWNGIHWIYKLNPCPRGNQRDCTDFQQPVCVILPDGTPKEFTSECEACADRSHVYFPDTCKIHIPDDEIL
jgi:hypothetical protein